MNTRSHEFVAAVNRFGLGADPRSSPSHSLASRALLLANLSGQPTSACNDGPQLEQAEAEIESFLQFRRGRSEMLRQQREQSLPASQRPPSLVAPGEVIARNVARACHHAATTNQPLIERLSLYWSDHFTASGTIMAYVGPSFLNEAIQPNLFCSFASLLRAACLHPAMLSYLDNARSVGPNSPTGISTSGRRGLNENLAREILELHTLGVHSGYTQDDVSNFAKALTGWQIDFGETARKQYRIGFFSDAHEPGNKIILGKTYADAGADQALAILRDLAHHPATAGNVTRRMVRHFVGHGLPGLEARLEATFLRTSGDLGAVTRALVEDAEAWGPPRKIRSPTEFLFATARLLGGLPDGIDPVRALRAMGQPFWAAPSPKGWPIEDEAWAAPDSIKTRLDWAKEVAARVPPTLDPLALLDATYGPAASLETRRTIARAADRRQGLALLLLSPEFQRR